MTSSRIIFFIAARDKNLGPSILNSSKNKTYGHANPTKLASRHGYSFGLLQIYEWYDTRCVPYNKVC